MKHLGMFFALLGHAFLWIGLVNRLHSIGVRRWIIKLITAGFFFCAVFTPVVIGWQIVGHGRPGRPAIIYLTVCWAAATITLLRWTYLRFCLSVPSIVRYHGRHRAQIDLATAAKSPAEAQHHLLARLPLNEILQLEVTQWIVDVPRMPPALDGLSIVHLSDLHFTGRVGKAYFREIVRICNELQPDLACITGDIVDRQDCFDWLDDPLGRLSARHGTYFVLGNHDRKVNFNALRQRLNACGLVDLSGRSVVLDIANAKVELIGNQRPWFDESVGRDDCSKIHQTSPLRIALAHTPDQFAWARKQDADLLLVGHTHGGQICIPPLGAIFAPTAHGVRYISGIYYSAPTIMHVSRGVSGDIPVRWNCRPEIAQLRLRAGSSSADQGVV